MGKYIALAAVLVLAIVGSAHGGGSPATTSHRVPYGTGPNGIWHDHPNARVVPAKGVRIQITSDLIARSCCMPALWVVGGNLVNTGSDPLDYVKLCLAFENDSGQVQYADCTYNHRASSLLDDAEVARIYQEQPHFDPIAPGGTDQFAVSVPTPFLPAFSKVELLSIQTRGPVEQMRLGMR